MPENLEPNHLESDSPAGSPASTGGQPEESERIKGFNRKINELNAQLEAAQKANATLKSQLDETKTTGSGALEAAQLQITQLTTSIKSLETERESYKTRAQELESQVKRAETREAQRKALLAADGTDLMEFFESGHFNLDGAEGEEVQQRIEQFRGSVAKLAQKQFGGAAQVTPTPLNTLPTNMSQEQLAAWLMKPENMDSPQYEAFREAYYSLEQ